MDQQQRSVELEHLLAAHPGGAETIAALLGSVQRFGWLQGYAAGFTAAAEPSQPCDASLHLSDELRQTRLGDEQPRIA